MIWAIIALNQVKHINGWVVCILARKLKINGHCYGSLLDNRLVNLGISKQQQLYLKTKNLI